MIESYYCKKAHAKRWRYDIYVRYPGVAKLKKRRASGFLTKEEATLIAQKVKDAARLAMHGLVPESARPTLAELTTKRLPTIENRAERTRASRVLNEWLELLPSGFQIQSIETAHIRLYVEHRQADGQAASSINRELNIIAATLNAAGEFFSSLKQWKTPKVPRPKVSSSRRERVISEEEYSRLLAALTRPPDERDGRRPQDRQTAYDARIRVAHIFQFAMLSAARHSEIMGLEWRLVDWANNRVLIFQSKPGTYKQIPITEPMRGILEYYKAHPVSERFVLSQSGHIYPKFYKILRRACEVANVPYGAKNPNGIVLHTARHTVTTRLVQAGNDLDTVGAITGHSAKELIVHYSHHSPASLARAAVALDGIGRKPKSE